MLLVAAALVFGSSHLILKQLSFQPRNQYRILVKCPSGYFALGPHNVTDAAIGAHFDDRDVVELWLGLSRAAAYDLADLARATTDRDCNVLLGEISTVGIDLPNALSDDVLTLNEVPAEFAERFIAALN